ncbi:MAG: hypothetical protein QXU67_05140, partial [Candidatus Bathyarchaeia archaeon]
MIIPGAGTYLEEQAKAQDAYEKAIATLKAQRKLSLLQAGLGEDYSVDPFSLYGQYQQMLQKHAADVMAAQEEAESRGLFGAGAGRFGEPFLRYQHGAENFGFQTGLLNYELEYRQRLAEAERAKQDAMREALQRALGGAVERGDFPPGTPGTAGPSSGAPGTEEPSTGGPGESGAGPGEPGPGVAPPRPKPPKPRPRPIGPQWPSMDPNRGWGAASSRAKPKPASPWPSMNPNRGWGAASSAAKPKPTSPWPSRNPNLGWGAASSVAKPKPTSSSIRKTRPGGFI